VTTDEKTKTAAAWARKFGELLQPINVDYRRNRAYSGRFIEYIRPLACGLYASQNCIAIRGTYYHCLAVLFSPVRLKTLMLFSPFYGGARFHDGATIQLEWYKEFGREQREGLHSVHSWRARAEELISVSCANAEKRLLPHYLAILSQGRQELTRLFRRAQQLVALSDREVAAVRASLSADDMKAGHEVTAIDVARRKDTSDAVVTATALAYLEDFRVLAGDLPRYCDALGAI